MSTTTLPSEIRRAAPLGTHWRLRAYFLEAWFEFLKLLRLPGYALPTLLFPALFYSLFGLGLGRFSGGRFDAPTYLLASYGAFGVIGASLFGLGVSVAVERGQGWMALKRASPMPPGAYLAAKLAMSALFGVLIVLLLSTLAVTFGGVRLPVSGWLHLGVVLVLGALPFSAFGLAVGSLAGPNSATPLVNILYLPLGFASGLWFPIQMLPGPLRAAAPWLPPYHLGELALAAVGLERAGPAWAHVAALAGFTGLSLCAAVIGFRRDSDRTWG
ncbi:MAG: ABC transporter permease [Acidobacteria bacterium]|nr:ABC transporter permease [Acidobacteriota bacterium]